MRRLLLSVPYLGWLLAAPASASTLSIDLIWSATTGFGTPGSDQIEALAGDLLTLDVWATTTGPEGLSGVGLSLRFDEDGKNELDLVSAMTISQPYWSLLADPGNYPLLNFESEAGQAGQVASFLVGTLDPGPVDTTFLLGQAVFEVNPSVQADGVDVRGSMATSLDGAFDNLNAPVALLSLGAAGVRGPVPEPSTGQLLLLGLVVLAVRETRLGSRTERSPPRP